MNREKAREILGEGATEEQITNLLNSYHIDETEKVKELEKQISTLTEKTNKYSDYDSIKKQLDDINKANMSEQEKLEAQKKEIEKNLRDSRIIVNTAKAKEILAGLDLDDDTISLVVTDDETSTINRANNLKTKFDTMKENVAKQTKESFMNADLTPPLPNVKQNENAIDTFAKFRGLSASEQEKWLSENPDGLSKLK